jgi:UDP-N-acetylmuramoyl-L-alanyl-D-glutamate--2,6-diaminopimelate ligase
MKPLQYLRHIVGLRSPLRIGYHWTRGVLAYALSGNPAKGMYVIGVTGTKGKTTTSTLIATALEASGRQVCLLSTAQVWMAGEKSENQSKMTMDSPFKLWRTIKKAKKMGVTHLVLETSSHGIYYFRNLGIKYDIVTLTNISQDHLDLHGSMDHYVKTKSRLFKKEHGKICVLPRDCDYFDIFSEQAEKDAITYSMKQPASYQTRSLKTDWEGIDIVIKSNTPPEEGRIISRLVGVFNAENILAAYATLRTMGIETAAIQEGWKNFTGVPGRMEPVPNTLGITILVDYAHTETSLRSVLETLKNNNQRMIVVFGATGDRDTTKRPKMGAVVHELADIIVLTDDDTYTEPSGRIIDMVKKWIPRETGDTFQIIPDRKEAIHWALRKAQKWDIVLIAGKWCETVQVTNAWPIPWSDRSIVEKFLG